VPIVQFFIKLYAAILHKLVGILAAAKNVKIFASRNTLVPVLRIKP
jgi:hypothetical protein